MNVSSHKATAASEPRLTFDIQGSKPIKLKSGVGVGDFAAQLVPVVLARRHEFEQGDEGPGAAFLFHLRID